MQVKYVSLSVLLILSIMFMPFHVHADKMSQITSTSTRVFLQESFVLNASGDACYARDFPITIRAGTEIFGAIKSSLEISFFIMTEAQLNSTGRRCANLASHDMVFRTEKITSYTLDWTAQATSKYNFIFLNTSANDASMSVTLWTQ